MTTPYILLVFISLLWNGKCMKLRIPHGLLQKKWQKEVPLSSNYVLLQPKSWDTEYSLVYKSNYTQVLYEFEPNCIYSCGGARMTGKCFVIYSRLSEKEGALQLCQDELLYFDVNASLPLAITYTNNSKQLIVNERERTRNEAIWTFSKVQLIYTLALLKMHPFQMTITNADNTTIVAQINSQQPIYPIDAYSYEFIVMNHTLYSPHELGLLLVISLTVDDLRIYEETGDEQY